MPGLKVVTIGTIGDARHILALALKEPGPVIILEYTSLLNIEGRPGDSIQPFGSAVVMKPGKDITLMGIGTTVPKTLEAAGLLKAVGLEAEVINLRSLRPLDSDTIYNSVRKTHRVLIAEDGWQSFGIGAEIAARISRECFYELDAPVTRMGGREVPVPYPLHLEQACFPDAKAIAETAQTCCGHD